MKIKPVDIYTGLYIEYCIGNIEKGSKFKVCDHVALWKDKIIFALGYTSYVSEEVLVWKK